MYVDASGNPVSPSIAAFPDGRPRPGFRQMVGPGEHIGFEMAFMDRSPKSAAFLTDAKKAKDVPPKSIDEALRQEFARKAENEGTTVEALLARMEQAELEKMAADVARRFVSSVAGAGVAGHFKDAASLLAAGNAAVGRLRVEFARRRWMADKSNAHRTSREQAERAPVELSDQHTASPGRGSIEQAREDRLDYLRNAHRG